MNREDQPHPRGRQMADPTAGAAYEYTRGPLLLYRRVRGCSRSRSSTARNESGEDRTGQVPSCCPTWRRSRTLMQPGAGRRTQDGRRPASDEGAAVRPVLDGRRRRDWRHQRQRSRKATNRFSMLPREIFDADGTCGRRVCVQERRHRGWRVGQTQRRWMPPREGDR